MIPLHEAKAHVEARCPRLPARRLPLGQAGGLVLAEPVVAAHLVPPFDNTAMDGFAVRAADTAGGSARLRVVGTLAAGGAFGGEVGEGQAVRIMTGAPMPAGADAVVMVERTEVDGDTVLVRSEARPGDHVRRAGDDVRPGDQVLPAGTPLGPAPIGVLASLGVAHVTAVPRATVGVLSTGDELVDGAGDLAPGQIRDSNRPALLAAVAAAGADAVDLGIARDDEAAIEAAVDGAVLSCDALLTSGGVSMGDFDYVKKVLDRVGDMRWMQIAIRPAKPFAFGVVTSDDGRLVPVFGLPGNPVSSLVSFEVLARPALRRMMGHGPATAERPRVLALAPDGIRRSPDGKLHLDRVVAEPAPGGGLAVRPVRAQGSHQLAATALANGIAVVPDGNGVEPGGLVETLLLWGTP
ncbi:MAG TPA: gephyrin-like molybdotransferase Glp [Acidimicrobiales bacterium]